MILRASSLNPNASPVFLVASECQKVSKPEAGETRTAKSMNNTTSLRNIFQSPAHRLEQHRDGLPTACKALLMMERTSKESKKQQFALFAAAMRVNDYRQS